MLEFNNNNKKEKIYVVSDIHLKPQDQREKKLIEFIQAKKGKIILLGDIFDIWIGQNKFYQKIFRELIDTLSKNKERIFYIEGNHDFNLVWLDEIGISRGIELQVKINGKTFLFSHGDMLSGELFHNIYRKIVLKTEPVFQKITNSYFDKAVNKIGEVLANLSHQKNMSPKVKGKRTKIFKNMIKNAEEIAKERSIDFVILGHCHIPSIVKTKDGKIIANSGFWGKDVGTYIKIEDGEIKLRSFKIS
jgi:UDP-2,3-diacylglucosamine pyrophosphatase LpxH